MSGWKGNNFSESDRFYLLEDNHWTCADCGRSHANCLHHIFGRGDEEQDDCESSPLNASPLNNFECHLAKHARHLTMEGKKKLLEFTWRLLLSRNYKLTEKDNRFLAKYAKEIDLMKIQL